MKRRSRGEQMLAATGKGVPTSSAKPVSKSAAPGSDKEDASPPAKRARPAFKADSPAETGQRTMLEPDSPTPSERSQKMPTELELLASMYDALRTGRMMLKRRSEKVTYNSVRHVVENMTKREFRVEHLAQMKYLQPEAFDWQYIRAPSTDNPQQLELQLLLTFDRPMASGADGSAEKPSAASELSEFRSRLENYVRDNVVDPVTGKLPPIPQAPLPMRPTISGSTTCRSGLASPANSAGRSTAGARLQSATDSPGGSSVSGPSASLTRSRSRLGMPGAALAAPSLTPILEGSTPTRHQSAPRQGSPMGNLRPESGMETDVVMREEDDHAEARDGDEPALELSQGASVMASQRSGAVLGSSCGAGAATGTPQSKGPRPVTMQTTPSSYQRPGETDPGLARLQRMLSPAALQKIMEVEAAQAAQTPEAKRRAELRRAVQLLPHGHELVRLVFGHQGPVVKPMTQVAQAMCERSTQRQGLTVRDASNTLIAMARAVPEFVRIDEPRVMADGSARPRSIVISRAANINAVAAKLKALSADPDAAMVSIFERSSVATAPAAAVPSPSGIARASSAPVPSSPGPHLKPRALLPTLESDNAAAATAEPGPPQPSARKRPPGLPLAPPSPAMRRGAQTPTRSYSLHAAGGLLGEAGPSAVGPLPALHGTPTRATAQVPAAGAELFQKLCRAASPLRAPCVGRGDSVVGGSAAGTKGHAPGEKEGEVLDAAVRTPGRARTPGRTAVQEAMLSSIRRSSAKRRQLFGDVEESRDGDACGDVDLAEDAPKPRRLEESLSD